MQALGSLVAKPWFGVVVSAVVFALLHGLQNPPLFVDRLAFGLLAGWLVWRTGGLEAGIAAHVVNNVFAYAIAGFTTSIAELKAIREISWVDAGFDVGGFALFAAAGVRAVPAAQAEQPGQARRRRRSRFEARGRICSKVAPRARRRRDHPAGGASGV